MTLAVANPVNSYIGNGSTNTYPFTYPVFVQSHLVVNIVAPSGSPSYLLVLGTDYTVLGLSPNGSPALSGNIVLINSGQAWLTGANLTASYVITITRVVPISQNTSVRNQGDFYPETLEDALDYITMILQQVNVPNQNPIYIDIVTGFTYQIVFVNGVLSQQRLT